MLTFSLLRFGRPLLALALLFGSLLPATAQTPTPGVGIGTTTPHAKAALEVKSTTKGLLPPRMTQAERDAIAPGTDAAGLTIYNTSTRKLNTWNGTSWDASLSATEQPFGSAGSFVFGYTGAPQTYTVPPDTYSLMVEARGASGGEGYDATTGLGSPGGGGARVRATLAVVPGQVLTLYVGGAASLSPTYPNNTEPGGYNGGGSGHFDGVYYGAAGGGASDVRTGGTALANRVLVAAGGGGGRANEVCNSSDTGGGGGAPNGLNGSCVSPTRTEGKGATQTSGYALGLGESARSCCHQSGGGGGYYGGYASDYLNSANGGSGGGGSSWVTPTGSSNVQMTAGANDYYPGEITITLSSVVAAPVLDGSNFVNVPGTWQVRGADVYRASGNVGIGTSTPTQKLDVAGNAAVSGSVGIGTAAPAVHKLAVAGGGAGVQPLLLLRNPSGGAGNGVALDLQTYDPGTNPGGARLQATDDGNFSAHLSFLTKAPGGASNALTERLRIASSGNVGIGTSTPLSRLSIQQVTAISSTANQNLGELSFVGFNRPRPSASIQALTRDFDDTGHLLFKTSPGGTGAVERVRITADGNVGIGATIPTQKLEVAGQIYSSTGGIRFPDNTVQTTAAAAGGSAVLNQTSLQSGASFNIDGSGTIGGNVTVGGSLGVGVAIPSQRLDVNGGLLVRAFGAINNQGAYLQWNRNNGDGATWLLNQRGGGGGGILFGSATTGNAVTEWARFDGTGNLGIGTPIPTQKLEVAGQIYSSTGGIRFPDNTVQTTAFTTAANGNYILNQSNQQSSASFNVSGSGTVGGALTAGSANITGNTTVQGNVNVFGTSQVGGTALFSGQVGINGVLPSSGYPLTVNGDISASGVRLNRGAADGRVLTSNSNGAASWVAPELTISNRVVSITGGNSVTVPAQTLSISNGLLSISGGNSVTVADNLGNHTATQNINLAGNLLTSNGGTTGLTVNVSGNVGIGTTSQTNTLEVRSSLPRILIANASDQGGALYLGNTSHGLVRGYFGGVNDVGLYTTSGTLFFNALGGSSRPQMTLLNSGRFGIGTETPAAPLHVKGSNLLSLQSSLASFFNAGNGLSNINNATGNRNVVAYFEEGEVWVDSYIVAGNLNTTSDRRIKNVIGLSDRAADLTLLNRLRITDYTYIDRVNNTPGVVKKVIAQEVEEVLPTAVTRSTRPIPNVYERATGVTYADGQVTVTMAKPHELPATGGRLRLYTATNAALNPTVTVVDAHTVRFAATEAYAAGLFVYGKYVDDFRSVDYDALTTLNVSATQELARKVAALEAENAAYKAQATQTTATLESLADRLRALEAGQGQARK